MSDPFIAEGHVVSGRYRLVRRLGEGGMGAVWLADHVTLRSRIAIKLLHRTVLEREDGLARFLREAQAAAMLRSPHVVQILDHGVDEGVPFIAMELLEGESLAARLARGATLSLAQTALLVTHVARAIGKAHDAGIVHRDLKPDNVFLVHNDDEEIAKVLDFGIAKMDAALAEPADKISTQEGALLGTPHYMSPEQVRGYGIDWRSDLWSLAIIAFECLCGRVPFHGRSVGDLLVLICSEPMPVPSTLRPLPPAFDAWFAKATARDVAARFQSAKEMAEALRAAAGEETREVASFTAQPAREQVGAALPDATTVEVPADDAEKPVSPSATTLDVPAEEARGRTEDGGRAAIEQARTLPLGDPMAESETLPATAAPKGFRAPRRLLAGVALVGLLALAAWLGYAGRGSAVAVGSTAGSAPATAPASAAPVGHEEREVRPGASATSVPRAIVAASSSASAGAAASAHVAASAKVPAAQPRAKSNRDELVF